MKRNTSTTIAIMTLLFLMVFQFLFNKRRVARLKEQMTIETAKKDFLLRQFDDQNVPFDSVYSKNDTVLFYKNGSFAGKTIVATE